MSHQNPYQQPHPPQFQPQPPRKSRAGKIVGFGCLGVIALFVLIGFVAALAGGGSDESSGAEDVTPAVSATASSEAPGAEEPAEKPAVKETPAEEPKPKPKVVTWSR